jgi:hypothetical protein
MRLIILTAALITACSTAPTPDAPLEFVEPANPSAWLADATLSSAGLGGIRVGESINSVQVALGYYLEQSEPVALSPGCGEWGIRLEGNGGVGIQTQDKVVRRITVHGPTSIRTAEGIGIGDTAAQVRAAYPTAIRESAEYTPAPGHELIVWSDPENYVGLRFEIGEDERVTAIHAGTDLSNDEGCATA